MNLPIFDLLGNKEDLLGSALKRLNLAHTCIRHYTGEWLFELTHSEGVSNIEGPWAPLQDYLLDELMTRSENEVLRAIWTKAVL